MRHIWKGDFWREFSAFIVVVMALWGMMVAVYERLRTRAWRWAGKTLLYAVLGGMLVIGVATLSYFIYLDILHIEYDQDVNHIVVSLRISKTVQPPILYRQVWRGRIYHHIAVKGEDSIFLIMASNMSMDIDRRIDNHIHGVISSCPIFSLRQPLVYANFPKILPDSISNTPSPKFRNKIDGLIGKHDISFDEYREMEIKQIYFHYEGKVNGKWMKGRFKGIGESGEFEAELFSETNFASLVPPPPHSRLGYVRDPCEGSYKKQTP